MSDTDDELASAWLDGELDDDERARAAADPAVAQARRELAEVREGLAEPVPVPAGLADRQVALALAALDHFPAADGAGVVRLDDRRRQPRASWLSRAAAAVLVLGGVGIGLAALSGDGDGGGGEDQVMSAPEARSAATADEAADSAAGSALSEELATTDEPTEQAAEDAEAAPVEPIAAAATELLAQDALDATSLAVELETRFGPARSWDLTGTPQADCGDVLDQRSPASAPHVALPITRDGRPIELAVPEVGPPTFVEPRVCEPIE